MELEDGARNYQKFRYFERRKSKADGIQRDRRKTGKRRSAHLIGERIRDEILPKLEPNKRIFSDLSITDAPDDGTLYKDEDEQWKNYSANYMWLKDLSDFCLQSKGFQVF
jgi:hypothetical protein